MTTAVFRNTSHPKVNILNSGGYISIEEINDAIREVIARVRINCGVANNCAYIVLSNALYEASKHPKYKHQIKKAFRNVEQEWKQYEMSLLNSSYKFFDVNDLDDAQKKVFGNISNRQLFEFWQGYGASAYKKTINEINSLRHKYRKISQRIGYDNPDTTSILSTAYTLLDAACQIYDFTLSDICKVVKVDASICDKMLCIFSPKRVKDALRKAMEMLYPGIFDEEITEDEERNIILSHEEISIKWTSSSFIFGSLSDACNEYSECFSTKGYAKRAARQAAELM